jgi:hypothetical protein
VSPAQLNVRRAAQDVIVAALDWADREYGEPGEVEAEAALVDAVRSLERAVERAGLTPSSALEAFGS